MYGSFTSSIFFFGRGGLKCLANLYMGACILFITELIGLFSFCIFIFTFRVGAIGRGWFNQCIAFL